MKNVARHVEVDLLRGLSLAGMIVIHTAAYFLSSRIIFFIWDASQFAVVAFIFCSAYLFFRKEKIVTRKAFFSYIKKRIRRLIFPYWVFVLLMLILVSFKESYKISFFYILQNVFLIGGIDINWLVLLFVIFSLLFPVVSFLRQKGRGLFYFFLVSALSSSLIFLFYRPPINYRLVMWLPWSLIIFFVLFFQKKESSRLFYWLGIPFFGILFFLLRLFQQIQGRPLTMFDNKYPPNLYHLSYGFFAIVFLWYVFKKGVFNFYPVKNILLFLSLNSYPIYFIHYVIIYVLTVFLKIKFSWLGFLSSVFFLTILFQIMLEKTFHLFSKAKSGPTI